jgi:adenine-specific DNA-methyltransferase
MAGEPEVGLWWRDKHEYAPVPLARLVDDDARAYGQPEGVAPANRLIHADNLPALHALAREFAGVVRCAYLDPPYNTGASNDHYDDAAGHAAWLSFMRDRLHALSRVLAPDGVLFIQIDDREAARLKLLLDEVFGPGCFKNAIIVRRGTKNVQSQFASIGALAGGHDTILLYARQPGLRLPKLTATGGETAAGKWDTFWRGTERPTMRYELFGIVPVRGQWRWREARARRALANYQAYLAEHAPALTLDAYWSRHRQETGQRLDFLRLGPNRTPQYYVPPRAERVLSDMWMDVRTLGTITDFPHEKHEELLGRIIRWTTRPGDWVIDCFAGSGTTAAAAHKLGRRWIAIEQGPHCETHIAPRLRRVIDGREPGGITREAGWRGGGGYRFQMVAAADG